MLGGSSAGGMAGHPVAGTAGGVGLTIGKKLFDRFGHSSLSRAADALADQGGAGVAGRLGAKLSHSDRAVDALAPYLDLLREEKDK